VKRDLSFQNIARKSQWKNPLKFHWKIQCSGGKSRREAPGLLRPVWLVWPVHLEVLQKNPSNKSKARPSFKELLAKYEKEEAVQKQKGWLNKVKDAKTSSKHQEQSDSHLSQGNYATEPYSFYRPIAPWYCWYLYYIYLDYSRMYMQSYFIHYPSIYPSCTLQRPIVASHNLVRKGLDYS
jgi:hypothetical protein